MRRAIIRKRAHAGRRRQAACWWPRQGRRGALQRKDGSMSRGSSRQSPLPMWYF